jgi:hypothetical protein
MRYNAHFKVLYCLLNVLNVHAPTEDKTDNVKDSFYEELERVFGNFIWRGSISRS